MGAPGSDIEAGDQPSAEALLDSLKTIDSSERNKHESVLAYWLSIRGNRELPPLRDLDPLQISDAGAGSILLELIGGGEDAEIRYLGNALKAGTEPERIAEAPRPSILASIAKKLSIVAISRNFLAFEEEFSKGGKTTRFWVTLLPLSSAGAWVDYVYAFVTFDADADQAKAQPVEELEVLELVPTEELGEDEPPETLPPEAEQVEAAEPEVEQVEVAQPEAEQADIVKAEAEQVEVVQPAMGDEFAEAEPAPPVRKKPGFTFDAAAAASGFYGTNSVKVEPHLPPPPAAKHESAGPTETQTAEFAEQEAAPMPDEQAAVAAEKVVPAPAAEPPSPKPTSTSEGSLQIKLTEVRAKADEARMAKLRANAALYEGLSAAYDFALEAEDSPEEYLKLVQAQGLKIQLRSPMRPVAKLAFDGLCDETTIAQLEAVLAWAFEQELPRGGLAERLEAAGGIGAILNPRAEAA